MIMDERVNIGDRLQVRMKLPSRKMINAQGRVLWISEYDPNRRGYKKMYLSGIEFTEIHDEYVKELNKFMHAYLPSKKE